jgi:hypothetical protein
MNSSRKLTQPLPQSQESMIRVQWIWLLHFSFLRATIFHLELENRWTYLACAIHLVIALQGRIEQWNSRCLANCHRESVESVHPVSFLSYLHEARRNFLVYLEGTLSREVFPQQKGLVCRLSEGPSSSELIYFCPVIQ